MQTSTMDICNIPSDEHPEYAIANWRETMGSATVHDPTLAQMFDKSVKPGPFMDKDNIAIIGVKVSDYSEGVTKRKGGFVNAKLEDGSILVADPSGIKCSSEMDVSKERGIWIAVSIKNQWFGYYKYVGRHRMHTNKYLLQPVIVNNSTADDEEIELPPPRKRIKRPVAVVPCSSEDESPTPREEVFSGSTVAAVTVEFQGERYDSKTEAKYAVFMNRMKVPFARQVGTGVLSNPSGNYFEYKIDFKVYPDNPSKSFFVEIKPFKPNAAQEQLCHDVANKYPGTPVYLLYGDFGVPYPIGTEFRKNEYNGIRYLATNEVSAQRSEGYVFMDRNDEICMDTKKSVFDMGFFSERLKQAYNYADNFTFN